MQYHGGDIYRNQIRLDFSVNTNPLGMPDGVEAALHEAVSSVQEYPDMEALALISMHRNLQMQLQNSYGYQRKSLCLEMVRQNCSMPFYTQ